MVVDKNTERLIFDAARRVFLKKGFEGARMQEIADEAGINKSLLHYYFRSKDKLFEGILSEAIGKISYGIRNLFDKEMGVLERLRTIVDLYIDTLSENRYLPLFVLNEMNQHPEKFEEIINKYVVVHLSKFLMQVEQEIQAGKIKRVNPPHLLLNVLAMVIFPFAAYPVVSIIYSKQTNTDFEYFLRERKKEVYDFIEKALDPNK